MKWVKRIPPYILLCFKVFLLQFTVFSLLRLVFFLFTNNDSELTSTTIQKISAFRMGFEFDMVVCSYMLIPAFLLLSIHTSFSGDLKILRKTIFFLLFLSMALFQFIWAADIPYYKQFGNHLNKQALLWESSPGLIIGMVFGNFSYWGYLVVFIISIVPLYYFLNRFFKTYLIQKEIVFRERFAFRLSYFIVIATLLVVGARGRLSAKSTTHEGLAVISDNAYINNLGLNPNFTFIRSVLSKRTQKYNVPPDINKQIQFTRDYFGITTPFQKSISRNVIAEGPLKKCNVVVVVMESMCLFKMGYYNGKSLTPEFNSIIKESVFFDKFFSSGIHTFNGLFSSSSGYPAILDEHSLMHYRKQSFQSLPRMLEKQNYEGYFFTTHDPHFDNMSGFFQLNGFKNVYSQYDMPSGKAISSLGVPDHVLFDKFIDVINDRKTNDPFVSYIMTASDHGPWTVPDDVPFKPTATDEKDKATQYADWALGYFMKKAKKEKWYDNTIFLFLGDHGLSLGHTYEMPLSYHHIPFVVHHPESLKPDTLHNLGYQPDVNATVMGLLNTSYTNESFGIDLFKQSHPFVLITADDKIGCVDNKGNYFYELLSTNTKRLRKYENLDPVDYYPKNRSLADSLESGAKSILEAARFFVHDKYYTY
ncbi:MAG: sulfatase-like hydrolase/transferase [Bacteroidota bacterium]|nr:sulfatase-like hydrolase/transferase [Bacteroidota bacterium]